MQLTTTYGSSCRERLLEIGGTVVGGFFIPMQDSPRIWFSSCWWSTSYYSSGPRVQQNTRKRNGRVLTITSSILDSLEMFSTQCRIFGRGGCSCFTPARYSPFTVQRFVLIVLCWHSVLILCPYWMPNQRNLHRLHHRPLPTLAAMKAGLPTTEANEGFK